MERVGAITAIARYPVKSMGGETLDRTRVSFQGIPGDRMWAFVQAEDRGVFPWLTGREMPAMFAYRAKLVGGRPPSVAITAPDGTDLAVDSDELREALQEGSGRSVRLLANYRGTFDVAAVSMISEATVHEIARRSGTARDPERFRMTFRVDTVEGKPFGEDAWVGRVVRLGAACRVAFQERDRRCVMTTLDPSGGGESSPSVLRAIAEANDAYAGIYGAVLTEGDVAVGDEVCLE